MEAWDGYSYSSAQGLGAKGTPGNTGCAGSPGYGRGAKWLAEKFGMDPADVQRNIGKICESSNLELILSDDDLATLKRIMTMARLT